MFAYLQSALLAVFPALVLVAALKDVTSYTIPNWISAVLIAAFFVVALAVGAPANLVGMHAAVGVISLLAAIGMFAAGWIGGGDAKLFAAAGLWLGLPAVWPYVLITAVAGGGLAVLLLNMRSPQFQPIAQRGPQWFSRLARPGENVPYGVAIAIGALTAFPSSDLMKLAPVF